VEFTENFSRREGKSPLFPDVDLRLLIPDWSRIPDPMPKVQRGWRVSEATMKTAIRVLVSVVAFLAVDCFVFWMSAGLLLGVNAPFWVSHLLGFACAAGAGWFVWTRWVGMAGSGVGRVISCGLFGAARSRSPRSNVQGPRSRTRKFAS
jgi:hypothetical protein